MSIGDRLDKSGGIAVSKGIRDTLRRAQAFAVARLARVLHCQMEDLLEPVVAVA